MIYYENELYHHGVKGQKWGRRKQRVTKGRSQMRAEYRAKNADRVSQYSQSKTASTNRRRTYASGAIGLGVGAGFGVATGLALKKIGMSTARSAELGAVVGIGTGYATKIISRKAMRNKR